MRRVLRGAFASAELQRSLGAVAESRDRAFITDLVYGTLRHLPYLDRALAERLPAPERLPDEVLCALRIGSYERLIAGTPDHAAVHAWVEVVAQSHPKLTGLANAVLRRLSEPRDLDPATELRLPPWLEQLFRVALGSATAAAARGMLEPEPLWLTGFHPDAASELAAEGCRVAPGPLPGTLRVRPARPLSELSAFRSGMVQPQNPSSALIATLLPFEPGERVLDLASGRGIKTAQLAHAGAQVTAVEIGAARGEAARRNLQRLGLGAHHLQADLSDANDPALAALEPAPHVLLDAPCSGTGTLRGHPEIKLRLSRADIDRLAARQMRMLDTAAGLTAEGGSLLYAVCALTPQEGEDQIASFLARHPGFSADAIEPPFDHVASAHGRYLLPIEGRDGFFVGRLRRGHGRNTAKPEMGS